MPRMAAASIANTNWFSAVSTVGPDLMGIGNDLRSPAWCARDNEFLTATNELAKIHAELNP